MGRTRFSRIGFPAASILVSVAILVAMILMYAQMVETYRLIGDSRFQLAELKLTWFRVLQGDHPDLASRLADDMQRFLADSAVARAASIDHSLLEHLDTLAHCWAVMQPALGDSTARSHPCAREIEAAFDGADDWIEVHLPRQTYAFRVILQMLLVVITAFGAVVVWLGRRYEAVRQEQQRRRRLTHAILNAQETERRVIALDIHDDALQTLSAAKNLLDRDHAAPQASNLLADGIARLRELAAGLSLYELDRIGLARATEALVDQFRLRRQIAVHFHAAGLDSVELPLSRARHVYRIVQELLNNAHKHSGATTVTLSMMVFWPELIIHYSDDGVGMPESVLEDDAGPNGRDTEQTGIGLQGIAERARLADSALRIQSKPGEGTRVRLAVPLHDGAGRGSTTPR